MRRTILLLLASTLIATACGGSSNTGSSADGEGTLIAAVLKLQGSPSTMTLTLRSDLKSLQALTADNGGDSLGGTDLNTVLNSSVTVSRTGASDGKDARSQTVVKIGDNDAAIETRMVDKKLYVRADVAYLLKTFANGKINLQDLMKEADAYGLNFMKPALEGKWLSLDGLDRLAGQAGTSLPTDAKKRQLSDAFTQRLLTSLSVKTVGEDAAGTHMEVSIPARQAYAALQDLIQNSGSDLPPGAAMPDPGKIPNKPITIDVWVRNGKLTQIELDLKKLSSLGQQPLPSGVHELALRIAVSDFTGTIEAPTGAVPVDLKALAKSFMSSMTGGSASSSVSSGFSMPKVNCSDLKAMRPKDLKSLVGNNPATLKLLLKQCPSVHVQA